MPAPNPIAETVPAVETGPEYSDMPAFRQGERPAAFADRIGEWYVARPSDRQRKAHGLFLTPVPVADHMGAQITAEGRKVRVLDPAAGTGILCCAAVEALVSRRPKPDAIELTACEVDGGLIAALRAVLDRLRRTHIGVGAQLLAQSPHRARCIPRARHG